MYSYKLYLAVVLAVALTGCGRTPEQQAMAERTDANVNRGALAVPEPIGVLPNGVMVTRVKIQYSDPDWNTPRKHYVYIVDGARTMSTNREEQEGKQAVGHTEVTIQLPPTATPSEIIKMGEDLRQKQESAEKALWEKLDQKYGKQ